MRLIFCLITLITPLLAKKDYTDYKVIAIENGSEFNKIHDVVGKFNLEVWRQANYFKPAMLMASPDNVIKQFMTLIKTIN